MEDTGPLSTTIITLVSNLVNIPDIFVGGRVRFYVPRSDMANKIVSSINDSKVHNSDLGQTRKQQSTKQAQQLPDQQEQNISYRRETQL